MNKNYSELKNKIFKKIEEIEKDDLYGKPLFLLLEKVEELVKCDCCEESKNFKELCKQLAYDYLVCKRRKYNGFTSECKNPSNFPIEKSPYDKENLVDCLTSWTEKRETLSCGDIEFNYLQNLDATYLILGKDSTGQLEHKKTICLLEAEKICKEEIRKYVNKESDCNPMRKEDNIARLDLFRYGFSPKGIKTNRILNQSCCRYLDEQLDTKECENKITPNENPNIFLTNCFVFLSAKGMSPSFIPSEDFQLSVNNFIMPLIDIIKPKVVIQGAQSVMDSINTFDKENFTILDSQKNYKGYNELLDTIHSALETNQDDKNSILCHIKWSANECTFFYPVNHPAKPMNYYKSQKNSPTYKVWGIIKKNRNN